MFKISIVIPTYNRAADLDTCLRSLMNQTYNNFEVIICDDGSTDDTKDVIAKYSNLLNINYRWNENWGGPAQPRNLGISLASGEWICFLDSDDSWLPDKLQRCLDASNEYDFIFHNMKMMRANKEIGIFKGRKLKKPTFSDLLIRHNPISNSSVFIRKSIIDQVGELSEDKALVAVEDFDYWLRIALVTEKFCFINKTLGIYNYGLDNITVNGPKQIARIEAIYNKYIPILEKKEQIQATLAKCYMLGVIYKSSGDYHSARKMFFRASFARNTTIKFKSFCQLILLLRSKKSLS